MRDRQSSPPAPSHGATLRDAEELSDLLLHRPLAARVVRWLITTPITPNQVTLLSGAAGVAAAAALAMGVNRPALRVASAVLLLVSTVLDCCDGQLARAKNMLSANGMVFDITADVVVAIAMVVAVTFAVAQLTASPRMWWLTPVVLASYLLQCVLFDVVKEQFFVGHRLKYPSSKVNQAERQATEPRGRTQRLFDVYWSAAQQIVRPAEASSRRPITAAQMRIWTFVGQGTHMTCLYVAAALSAMWPQALYGCLLVFVLVMNAVVAVLFASGASPWRG